MVFFILVPLREIFENCSPTTRHFVPFPHSPSSPLLIPEFQLMCHFHKEALPAIRLCHVLPNLKKVSLIAFIACYNFLIIPGRNCKAYTFSPLYSQFQQSNLKNWTLNTYCWMNELGKSLPFISPSLLLSLNVDLLLLTSSKRWSMGLEPFFLKINLLKLSWMFRFSR